LGKGPRVKGLPLPPVFPDSVAGHRKVARGFLGTQYYRGVWNN